MCATDSRLKRRSARSVLQSARRLAYAAVVPALTSGAAVGATPSGWTDYGTFGTYARAVSWIGAVQSETYAGPEAQATAGSSLAWAGLASGQLRVRGIGQAQWYEYVTFYSEDPTVTEFETRVDLLVNGLLFHNSLGPGGAAFSMIFTSNTDSLGLGASWFTPNFGTYNVYTSSYHHYNLLGDWDVLERGGYSGTLTLPIGEPIFAAMALEVVNGDFSHTAEFDITLPPGISYTSASGVFLSESDAATSVSEPASISLILAGLAMLALGSRKKYEERFSPDAGDKG